MRIRNMRHASQIMHKFLHLARAGHLRKPLCLILLAVSAYFIVYLVWFTPVPVYMLDKMNLRPFFLPNILCNHCNNFSYQYLVANEDFCKVQPTSKSVAAEKENIDGSHLADPTEHDDEVFLLILVATYHPNMNARQAIRKSWGNVTEYRGKKIKTLFMFGTHADKNYNFQVRYELEHYGDVMQGDFEDSYLSLTNKSVMGLRWVQRYCSNARYVLKTDDDAFNVPQRFVDYLLTVDPNSKFIGGYCFTVMPDRRESSKFHTPVTMYPEKYYPTYCSGPGYLLSRGAVDGVVSVAPNVLFITMEDVFVTGLCRVAAKISYTQVAGVAEDQTRMTSCNLATWVKNGHNIYPNAVPGLWKRVQAADKTVDCLPKLAAMYMGAVVFVVLWCLLLYWMLCSRTLPHSSMPHRL